MTGIQPTTLAAAGPIMAEALGKDWRNNREEVLSVVNDYRNLLFNLYAENELFSNIFECVCVSCFRESCLTGCGTSNSYFGFSVPARVGGIEAIYDYGQSLILRSGWRETFTGLPSNCGQRCDAQETGRQFPTERDLDSNASLKVHASSTCDDGLVMRVEVVAVDNTIKYLDFTLKGDSWQYVSNVFVREIRSVALPSGRKGQVTLAQTDGRVLSLYAPAETVPAYRRFRVPASCHSRSVLIQGDKLFFPIFDDFDIVEVGDPLAIKHAGAYFKHLNGTTDARELRTAELHLVKLKDQLAGLKKRARGRAYQDGTPARGRPTTRNTILPGYRRR